MYVQDNTPFNPRIYINKCLNSCSVIIGGMVVNWSVIWSVITDMLNYSRVGVSWHSVTHLDTSNIHLASVTIWHLARIVTHYEYDTCVTCVLMPGITYLAVMTTCSLSPLQSCLINQPSLLWTIFYSTLIVVVACTSHFYKIPFLCNTYCDFPVKL